MHAPRGIGSVIAWVVMLAALVPAWADDPAPAPGVGGGDAPVVDADRRATDAPVVTAGGPATDTRAAGGLPGQAPAISVAEGYVFVVQRGTLYQFTVDSLEETAKVRLNVPGRRGRLVAAGGGQGEQRRIRLMLRTEGAEGDVRVIEGDPAELENADLGPNIRRLVQTFGGPRAGTAQAAPAIFVSDGYVFVVHAGTLFQFTVDSLEEVGKVRLSPPARRAQVTVDAAPARD